MNLAEYHADIIVGFNSEEKGILEGLDPSIGSITLREVHVANFDPSTYISVPIQLETCTLNDYFDLYGLTEFEEMAMKTALCVPDSERHKLNVRGHYQGRSMTLLEIKIEKCF